MERNETSKILGQDNIDHPQLVLNILAQFQAPGEDFLLSQLWAKSQPPRFSAAPSARLQV